MILFHNRSCQHLTTSTILVCLIIIITTNTLHGNQLNRRCIAHSSNILTCRSVHMDGGLHMHMEATHIEANMEVEGIHHMEEVHQCHSGLLLIGLLVIMTIISEELTKKGSLNLLLLQTWNSHWRWKTIEGSSRHFYIMKKKNTFLYWQRSKLTLFFVKKK